MQMFVISSFGNFLYLRFKVEIQYSKNVKCYVLLMHLKIENQLRDSALRFNYINLDFANSFNKKKTINFL